MDIQLIGTGTAEGFPVPGCPCAACASAQRPARRPARLGFLPRSSTIGPSTGIRPGVGLPWWQVLVDCTVRDPNGSEHRLDPDQVRELDGFSARRLGTGAPGQPIAVLIRTDRDEAILWAPQAGSLSAAVLAGVAGITLTAVLLGPAPDDDPGAPGPEQSPLVDCALGLAQLRAAGSVTGQTRALLVGVGHRERLSDRPELPDRLAACLAHWAAQAPPDGTMLTLGNHESAEGSLAAGLRGPVGRTLVLGGSASGKSDLAEQLLAAWPDVLYLATGPKVELSGSSSGSDPEWAQRVRRHRARRPPWWQTEETDDVATLLATTDRPVLLDSVGTWLAGVLDRVGAWDDDAGWRTELAAQSEALLAAWRGRRAPLVAVSDEVGWGVVPATASGRLFRDELGRLNRRLAAESERVLLVMAGRLIVG